LAKKCKKSAKKGRAFEKSGAKCRKIHPQQKKPAQKKHKKTSTPVKVLVNVYKIIYS